ncbi:MAG: DUF2095 family protein [Promethearchaeota archaeon]
MNQKKKKEPLKDVEVEEKNGIKILYNENEFNKQFPHLTKEISSKQKFIKINSVKNDLLFNAEEKPIESMNLKPEELYNPQAIDFIRRCTNKEEAIDILDYLLKRNEISQKDYETYVNIISQEGGLTRLIAESGGLKEPGYYMRKYYKKLTKDQKLNSNKD